MGRKRKYKTVAEKQRAWRIRHGIQKVKVPIPIRRGEDLGTSEGSIRAKKEGETWKDYHTYITERLKKAHASDRPSGLPIVDEKGVSVGAKRGFGKEVEPQMTEDYYELRVQYEKGLMELDNKRKKISKK